MLCQALLGCYEMNSIMNSVRLDVSCAESLGATFKLEHLIENDIYLILI